MALKRLYSCGAGGNFLLLTGNSEDLCCFTLVTPPVPLKDFNLAGNIAAGITEDGLFCVWGTAGFFTFPITINVVACGWAHVLLLATNSVLGYGKNTHGQLGLTHCQELKTPVTLGLNDCRNVACGFRTSYFITETGVFACGENRKFQLGLGHKEPVLTPTMIPGLRGVTAVSGGNKHAIATDGTSLYCWGQNTYGQLALPDCEYPVHKVLPFPEGIKQIACGWYFSGVLSEASNLYFTGRNNFGQLGTGNYENASEFTLISAGVSSFAVGTEHVLIVKSDEAFAWGWNEHGNLGNSAANTNSLPLLIPIAHISQVRAGGASSFLVSNM